MAGSRERTGLPAAWNASPGPRGPRQSALLALKGLCMGAADIIPGVSGGTIAFITGIYEDLVAAIRSFDVPALKRLLRFDLSGALAGVHARFLFWLLIGIGASIITMSRVIHTLMAQYPVQVWALFFGLIAASIVTVARHMGGLTPANLVWVALGAAASYLLVGMIPVTTPETAWFVFLCGAIAICAMILPGISGAFLLLMLGKYEYVTGALKNPFDPASAAIIATFLAGAVVGIVIFSRFLNWLLQNHHSITISLLTGFMIGALRKVWPWKDVLETQMVRGREVVLREANVLPGRVDAEFWLAIGLAAAGVVLVLLIERLSHRHVND